MTHTQGHQDQIAYVRKVMRSKAAKTNNWPGAPLSHFSIDEDMPLIRDLLDDCTLVLIERPKANPAYTATFVAVK